MQVSKWGNSLAVRLPAKLVEQLGLKEGDDITIHIVGTKDIEIEKTPDRRALYERLRKFRGRMPKDFKFDRLASNVRK
jgi:antitoxin MazE